MADVATATASPSPSTARPSRARRAFRRVGGVFSRTARRVGGAARRSYRSMYERRGARRVNAVARSRQSGRGLVRWGKVALLWVAGGIVASAVDHLLEKAGLDSPLARFILEAVAGAAFILLGGPSLGSFGAGMILGAGGNLLHAEVTAE